MADDSRGRGAREEGGSPSSSGTGGRPARCEAIVDAIGDGVYQLDLEGRFVAVNDAVVEATGYDREELLGEHASQVVAEADVEAVAGEVRDLLGEGSDAAVTRELTIRTADGRTFPADTRFSLLREDGEVVGTVGVVRDVEERRERERELRRERDFVDQLIEAVAANVVVIEEDGDVVRANERAKDYLELDRTGVDRAAIGDRDVYDEDGEFVPPDERPYMRVFETGEAVRDWQCRVDLHERGRRWLSVNAIPIYGDGTAEADGGEVEQVVVTAEDITRIKEQARQLRRERDELAGELDEVFERIDDAFYAVDEEFRFTYVNERAEELLQHAEEELLGRSVWEVFPEARESPARESFHEALETQEQTGYEVFFEPLGFWIEATVYPSESGLSVYFRDVTERKQREQELERYETIVETTREGIYATDAEGRYTMANDAYLELTGSTREELLGSHASEVIPEDEHDAVFEKRRELRAGEREVATREGHYELADGTHRVVETRFTALTDADGQFLGTTGAARDITARTHRERELERYETMFEEATDVNAVLDPDGTFRYLTPSVEHVLGYDPGELVGENAFEYIHPEDRESTMERFAETVRSAGSRPTAEYRFRHADGSWRWLEARGRNLLDDPQIEGIVAYTRDITGRKRREEHVRQERDRFTALFETIPEAVVHVRFEDGEPMVRTVNSEFEDVFGYAGEDLAGASLNEYIVPDRFEEEAAEIDEATNSLSRIEREVVRETAAGEREFLFRGVPFEAEGEVVEGIGVYIDITERKARERALEEANRRYETLIENFPNGAVALVDEDLRYRAVGGTTLESAPDDLEGRQVEEAVSPELAEVLVPRYRAALAGEQHSFEHTTDGRTYRMEILPVRTDDGEIFAALGMSQDVTERKERERELEQYRALTRAARDTIVTIDETSTVRSVNPAIEEMLGYEPADLVGESLTTLMPDRLADRHTDALERYLRTGETHVDWNYVELPGRHRDGREVPLGISFSEVEYGGRRYFTGIMRDISGRKERERQLEEYETIVETMPDGVYVLDEDHRFALVNDAFCELTGFSREELLGVDAEVVSTERGHERGMALREQLAAGEIDVAVLEEVVQTAAGDTIDTEIRFVALHDENGEFRGTAGVVRDITARLERKRELERQREQLAALNELNEVVRGINEALVRQSTREEVERVVCEQLAGSDSYRFAWIGDVEPHADAVRVRTGAGSQGYVDDLDLSIDADDPTGRGPTARAFRTGEMQVVRDILEDPDYEPWRDRAEAYGFRSSAAIPITYEGTLYGVLNVYAERPHAFDERERDVVGQLGEVVGHAINAIERKQALMSDEVVELEFQVKNVVDRFDVPDGTGGRITFDRAVPIGDDEFLVFGTASGDAFETLEALAGSVPHFGEVTALSEGADEVRYEMHLEEPPVLSAVAAHGGRVRTATIEDGDYRMTVELPPSVGVRRITGTVRDAYPGAEILAQRQTTRQDRSPERIREAFVEDLTDRQRTALETAYYAGFFDWPRESTGEEVAASLDIAPATFHQHLRAGQNKLLGALFSDGTVES